MALPIKCVYAKKMLVVMIGIGIYDEGIMLDLIGASRDYCNVKYTFNYKRGYHVIYNTCDNKIEYISNRIKKNKYIKDNFKLRWTRDEIFDFNKSVLKIIADSKSEFDGLIYLLSCHGDTDNVIYDSTRTKVKVQEILKQFSNSNCAKLRNKPKIAILDFCRGEKRMIKQINTKFHEQKEEISQNDDSKNNDKNKNDSGNKNVSSSNNNNNNHNNNNNNVDNSSSSNSTSDNSKNSYNDNDVYVDGLGDFREIYGTLSGYAATDGGLKGGYLIRSFTKIIGNEKLFNRLSLDEMIMQTKKVMSLLLGTGLEAGTTVIDDVNRLTYSVKLLSNEEENNQTYFKQLQGENETEYKSTQIRPKIANNLASTSIYTLSNPLVVLLCIGKYCKKNQDGIKFSDIRTKSRKDYMNLKYVFNYKLGYSVIYMVGDNSRGFGAAIRHHQKRMDSPKRVKDNFKLEWNENEIEMFNETIKKTIGQYNCNYDGLIYIISCHGGADDIIYDSEGEEYALPYLFEQFNNVNCKKLRNKPKIFVIDTDRREQEIEYFSVGNDDNNDNDSDNDNAKKCIIKEIRQKMDKSENKNSADEDSKDSKEKKESEDDKELWNERYYCEYSDFRLIYSNAEGYKKMDSINSKEEKGSFLIRAFTKVVAHEAECEKSLTDILIQTKDTARILFLKKGKKDVNQAQIIKDTNRMPYFIKLKKRV